MPITIPLYSAIFDKEPEGKSSPIAKALFDQNNKEKIQEIIEHIDDEIEHPKQNVSDILDFKHPNEEKLRNYLKNISNELKRLRA